MKKKVLASLLVAAKAVGMMAGCGKSGDKQETTQKTEAKEESSGELTKISVCEPVRGILWAPVYVAKAEGYFEEEGLDVDITTVQ